jgi:hypothetical protein
VLLSSLCLALAATPAARAAGDGASPPAAAIAELDALSPGRRNGLVRTGPSLTVHHLARGAGLGAVHHLGWTVDLRVGLTERLSLFGPGLLNLALLKRPRSELLLSLAYGAAVSFDERRPDGWATLSLGPGLVARHRLGRVDLAGSAAAWRTWETGREPAWVGRWELLPRFHLGPRLRLSGGVALERGTADATDARWSFGSPAEWGLAREPLVSFAVRERWSLGASYGVVWTPPDRRDHATDLSVAFHW